MVGDIDDEIAAVEAEIKALCAQHLGAVRRLEVLKREKAGPPCRWCGGGGWSLVPKHNHFGVKKCPHCHGTGKEPQP